MTDAAADLATYLGPIIPLTERFVAGEVNGEDYEVAFFQLYQQLPFTSNESLYETGERFFAYVEDHVFDDRLREPEDVSTDQLIVKAKELLQSAGL